MNHPSPAGWECLQKVPAGQRGRMLWREVHAILAFALRPWLRSGFDTCLQACNRGVSPTHPWWQLTSDQG